MMENKTPGFLALAVLTEDLSSKIASPASMLSSDA
jgi:hypothetical protein